MTKAEKPEDPEYRARAVALRLLARREHSRQELATKLRQREIEAVIIERVLDEYEESDWLSDIRFADVYARHRRDLAYGPVKIRAELQQRGISFEPECLAETPEEAWVELAIRWRQRRFGLASVHDNWPEKARQARSLSQRGFTGGQIDRALEAVEDTTTGAGLSSLD